MPALLPKAQLLKRLTLCRIFVPYHEEKYSNYLEKKYTGKNLPTWMNSDAAKPTIRT